MTIRDPDNHEDAYFSDLLLHVEYEPTWAERAMGWLAGLSLALCGLFAVAFAVSAIVQAWP